MENKKQCTCTHEYQDQKYGDGIRVHNPLAKKKEQPQQWRCTVCKAVRK